MPFAFVPLESITTWTLRFHTAPWTRHWTSWTSPTVLPCLPPMPICSPLYESCCNKRICITPIEQDELLDQKKENVFDPNGKTSGENIRTERKWNSEFYPNGTSSEETLEQKKNNLNSTQMAKSLVKTLEQGKTKFWPKTSDKNLTQTAKAQRTRYNRKNKTDSDPNRKNSVKP